jgi:HPr kinase/phosphorylase
LTLVHASCVAIDKKAVLIAGPPGAGKSDLALRLIDEGAHLVADDQTLLTIQDNVLLASAPSSIAGLFEVRHVGLITLAPVTCVPVALYIELSVTDELSRLPDNDTIALLDHPIRRLRLPAYFASTPAKIRVALHSSPIE